MGKQGQSWVWGLEGSKKDSCHELILSMSRWDYFFILQMREPKLREGQ